MVAVVASEIREPAFLANQFQAEDLDGVIGGCRDISRGKPDETDIQEIDHGSLLLTWNQDGFDRPAFCNRQCGKSDVKKIHRTNQLVIDHGDSFTGDQE